ncbi:MAG: tRNA (adenosine(37)-N6)-threonylcarbamoyltransferase complex dimerization subunit type 1 TsaB [Nitrospirae bacterium]|nr:tRNA (adenosine(37)-N6)-threonylcarbamoyltransferase complex dimerization subunit type 1 TsaB [Nitrospirota bacterium]
MKVLAIDTSSAVGSAAVLDTIEGLSGCRILRLTDKKNTHSQSLMPSIDFLLKTSGLKISDVGLFVVTLGPGSFTGLRIGLSTVNGFSFATGKPVAGVSALECLAWNFPYSACPVCTIIDARRGDVYGALFTYGDNGFSRLLEEGVYNAGVLMEKLSDNFRDYTVFTGDACVKFRALIEERLGDKALFAGPDKTYVSAATAALIGVKEYEKGRATVSNTLKPLYFKRPQAEEKLNDKKLNDERLNEEKLHEEKLNDERLQDVCQNP